MWYEILTMVNILGSSAAIFCLVRVFHKYQMGPRMSFYIFLSMVAMLLLIMGQVYSFLTNNVRWVYKIPTTVFWLTKIYFCWMVRFNLIKKK